MNVLRTRRFAAMGARCAITVAGGPAGLPEAGARRVAELEAAWSRFRPTSELARLNAADGEPLVLSPDVFRLVATSVAAWQRTAGRFDPTLHGAVVSLGYASSRGPDGWPAPAPLRLVREPAPGCAGIELDAATRRARLPRGVRLDAGGIGKGLAGDIVAAELLAAGAEGVLVSLGGDLVCAGDAPGGAWAIHVEHPLEPSTPIARLSLEAGAVATTSAARRRFGVEPHLLDPRDGLPAQRPWLSATVVAGAGWWAEALAKAAYLDGSVAALDPGASTLLADAGGRTIAAGAAPWQAAA